MACQLITFPDGTRAIVCGPRRRAALCEDCGARSHELLCDAEAPGGGTCDRRLCRRCACHIAGVDLCRHHTREREQLAAEFGAG